MSQDAAEWHGMDQAASQRQDPPGRTAVGAGGFACPPGGSVGPRTPPESLGAAQVWGTGESLAPTELGGCVLLGTGVTSMRTPHLCDPRRQGASCQHCHLVLEGW